MHKTIGMLGMLLAAQLMLAVAMSFTGPSLTAQRPDTPLIELAGQEVDRVSIAGQDNRKIVLARQSDGWVLPENGDFPVDKNKVNLLLAKLQDLKRGLAVATSETAQQRFKVGDDTFERRIDLMRNGEPLATLFLGTSPGMRQVHARTADDTAVYTTAFGIYDAPLKPEDWEDKGVLKIPQDAIASIDLGALALQRSTVQPDPEAAVDHNGGQESATTVWESDSLDAGETLNQANANALAQKLATLTFAAVLGREAKPAYGLESPALAFEVQRQGGERLSYRIGRHDGGNDYVLKVSSRPEYFRLPAYTADELITAAGRDRLVTVAVAAAADGDAGAGTDASTTASGMDTPAETRPAEDAP